MAKQVNEADILFAEKEIKIGDETITIKPYSWAQSMKLVKPLGTIMHVLINHIDDIHKVLNGFNKSENIVNQVMPFINLLGDIEGEELVDALTEFMAVAARKDEAYIQALMLDDAFKLANAVYDVNKSFFTKRLATMKMNQPSKKAEKKSQ